MAHFSQIDENNIVATTNVIADSDCLDSDNNESEAVGIAFCKSLWGDDTNWVQTSYNNTIRKQYAHVGYFYDATKDKFITPKPYPSWVLDGSDDYQAPIAKPREDKQYHWVEADYQADNSTGWVLDAYQVPE